MEILCVFLFALVLLTVVGHGVWVAVAWLFRSAPEEPFGRRQAEAQGLRSCPACEALLTSWDQNCPGCGLDARSPLANHFEALQVAGCVVRGLSERGELDTDVAGRVAESLNRRRRTLLEPPRRPTPTAPAPVPKPPPLPVKPVVLPKAPAPVAEPPTLLQEPPAPAGMPAEPPPRRRLASVLAGFLEQRNILWGELVGGLLIVGCSVALALTLWRSLAELPYFPFLLFAGITALLFAAGRYTLHHWRLSATSRGLMVIALLLVPLNLLLLADPGPRAPSGWVDGAVKAGALVLFVGLVSAAGRDLFGMGLLPGPVGWRWLLALAVVGAAVPPILPVAWIGGLSSFLVVWLPLLCQMAACGAALVGLHRQLSRARGEPLVEAQASALLIFVGLAVFTLLAAWGSVLSRAADLPEALRRLALPLTLAAIPVLEAGLLVQRRLTRPAGLRVVGTVVALAGMVLLIVSPIQAWPDPANLLLVTAAVGVVLTGVAFRECLPWAQAGALPALGLAFLLAFQGLAGKGVIPAGAEPGTWLANQLTSAASGAALAVFAALSAGMGEWLARRQQFVHARSYALGGAALGAVSLLLVSVHGVEQPLTAAAVHILCTLGFLLANVRWRLRVVAEAGVWLVLPASLWFLWAAWPGAWARWGLAISVEALLLALAALGLTVVRRDDRTALGLVRDACRNGAAAAGLAAATFALFTPGFPAGTLHTGTLLVLAATAFVLARLVDRPVLTWLGSGLLLLGLAHLTAYTAEVRPHSAAILVALLIHGTAALSAALAFRRQGLWQRLFVEPLRWSAGVTACLALPLLLWPDRGLALAWAGLALWAALLWLLRAWAWSERGGFSVFQATLSAATVLAALGWVERQDWSRTSNFGLADPRAWQACGIGLGLLSLGWVEARRWLRAHERVRHLWSGLQPSVDQLVLGGLVLGQMLLVLLGVMPGALAELVPAGASSLFTLPAEMAHAWGPGAWALVGVVAAALLATLRFPPDEETWGNGPLIGLVVLALTVPILWAGTYTADRAIASALRWGLASTFLAGSALLAFRGPLSRFAWAVGLSLRIPPAAARQVRAVLAVAVGMVLVLTAGVIWLDLTGPVPGGPASGSVFARLGPVPSTVMPLALLVTGLVVSALRERSPGYAFAAGLVFSASVTGGYALAVTTAGGTLDLFQQVRLGLLAAGSAALWALLWQAAEGRVPGGRLLLTQVALGLAGITGLALIPLSLLVLDPARPIGPAFAQLGQRGWLALGLAAAAAGLWYVRRAATLGFFHVVVVTGLFAGVLAACGVQLWDVPGRWLSFHVLAAGWVVLGLALVVHHHSLAGWEEAPAEPGCQPTAPARLGWSFLFPRINSGGLPRTFVLWPSRELLAAQRAWLEVLALAFVALGLRSGWTDPNRPIFPAGMSFCAGLLIGAVALRLRSQRHVLLSMLALNLAGIVLWMSWGPDTLSSLVLTNAVGLALAAAVWSVLALRGRQTGDDFKAPWAALVVNSATKAALALLLFGIVPTLAGWRTDELGLAWSAAAATGLALGTALWGRQAGFARGGLYTLGLVAVGLGLALAGVVPVWHGWQAPVVLAAYALAASIANWILVRWPGLGLLLWLPARTANGPSSWLPRHQAIAAIMVLVLGVRLSLSGVGLAQRLAGPLALALLVPAAALLGRVATGAGAAILRRSVLALAAAALGAFGSAVPDPAGVAPWLQRNAWLFVTLAAAAVACLEALPRWVAGTDWAVAGRWLGAWLAGLTLVTLGVLLAQQVPLFDPGTRRTPLARVAVFAVLAMLVILIGLAIRLALRPDRDPLSLPARRRSAYVYLAELLLALVFIHLRLNVPEMFGGYLARYWTFLVMALAFVGLGLGEYFERRRLGVLARPLRRTGMLLPLIPLLAFWAKPPGLLGYLDNLPQHYDTYALLWFLAGGLYALQALSRWSFGWAFVAALAANAGVWALLAHHEVPAAIHPQAWAIPLALIVLVSEQVHRGRLSPGVSASLRYLGISMIYVASTADLFIAGVGQSLWLPVILAVLCVAGVLAGIWLRVRAFLFLGVGFLLLDVFAMIWHAAVNQAQTWVWYVSGLVLGAAILTLFALIEKRRDDLQKLVEDLRRWD